MGRTRRTAKGFDVSRAKDFLNYLSNDKPLFPWMIALILIVWSIERWFMCFTNFVPLSVAVWATYQYGNYQSQIQAKDLERRWKQVMSNASPVTPLEHCEWFNKLLNEIWPNFVNPKLSLKFSSIVEERLKHRKPPLIEKIELEEFSLGSCPPSFGLNGTCWSMFRDQRTMRTSFDWDTTDVSILLVAKLTNPLMRIAKIAVKNVHIKGELLLRPILDGKAVLYSFLYSPEVRIDLAFGTGETQSLPATEFPIVSSWLVKVLNDTIEKTMVEPRRRCLSLPSVDLRKSVVGGMVYVKVISASELSVRQPSLEGYHIEKDLSTFVEVKLEQLSRKTDLRSGTKPKWNASFNMVLHDEMGILKFHLYESNPGNARYNHLATCEIKMKYVADDSVIYWALGPDNGIVAQHAEFCGKEVEMIVPFEGMDSGKLTVRLILKEWHCSDGSLSLSHLPLSGSSSSFTSKTGRKISVTVVEGKDLIGMHKFGKCDPYVKLQYGKDIQETKVVRHTTSPVWDKQFEFEELTNGEYLKIKCYSDDTFIDKNLGGAQVSLEGLIDGCPRDVWVPLENVDSGDVRLKIEASKIDDNDGSNAWIELVLIEAKDLVAADRNGKSDPYVRVHYGSVKEKTKVMYKTLNPIWNQKFKFLDDGSHLALYVKDHNTVLPTSSIGECVVNYQQLDLNQPCEKWVALEGVKNGEIRIRITRKNFEVEKRLSFESETCTIKAHRNSCLMKQIMIKLDTLVDGDDLGEVSESLRELERLYVGQEEYMIQLETEKKLLLDKISELDHEILNSSPP
ncbi:extended synaptotagmin-1-like [Impatiens glandulifera]|uniref:extended synaptotagmin-1-like n=1 Tax=Impatiens glandulifera TaxID=253017 RepID=UPI001FB06C3E|nr:extended synaptotagmin-1-like [Impatiens glandulifera]